MDASVLSFLHFLERESRIVFVCLALGRSKLPEAVTQCTDETHPAQQASKRLGVLLVAWACPGELTESWGNGVTTQKQGGVCHTEVCFGPLTTRRILRGWIGSREGQQSW